MYQSIPLNCPEILQGWFRDIYLTLGSFEITTVHHVEPTSNFLIYYYLLFYYLRKKNILKERLVIFLRTVVKNSRILSKIFIDISHFFGILQECYAITRRSVVGILNSIFIIKFFISFFITNNWKIFLSKLLNLINKLIK